MKLDSTAAATAPISNARETAMRQAAQELEATFLAEMLKPMGAGASRDSFGGGLGEEHFTTFLLQEESRAMVQAGGVGLAESIFQAMKKLAESNQAGGNHADN